MPTEVEVLVSTLLDLQNASDERRSWIVRSVALVVVAAFVLAGLTGMFGVASATATAHSPRGLSVLVTYPRRARPALAIPFSVTITKPGGFDHSIKVATSTDYLAAFDENGLNPDPASSSTNQSQTIWSFDPPDGDTLTVWLDTRIEPGVQWRRRGTTAVSSGDETVTVHYTSWILP